MKTFLKNIIKFILIFYGSLFTLIITSNHIINKNADFKLAKNIQHIIIGNSQPECAYNDSLITNFKNLSKSAETYFYSYQKLKKVLEQNSQIESLFVEFSNISILIREDQKIWENRMLNFHLPNLISFLSIKDYKLLGSKNFNGLQQTVLKSLSYNIERVFDNQYNFIDSIGGYNYLTRQKTKLILDTLTLDSSKQHFLSSREISTYDLQYLEEIIELSKKYNIKIYFTRSPFHQKFFGNRYEKSFQKIRQEKFSNIEFLDFKDFPLQNSEFGDLQHLNYKGARKFSLWFNSWLQDQNKK